MVTVLIGSSRSDCIIKASKYLAEKYMPEFNKIYLKYDGDLDGWSQYLSGFLSYLTDEFVMFGLDDFLISDYVEQTDVLGTLWELKDDVVCIKLCMSNPEEHNKYPVTTQISIWNREYLIDLLRETKGPWNFEVYGSKIIERKVLLRPCIKYDCNSSTSFRWEGYRLDGLKEEDIEFLKINNYLL